MNFIDRTDIRFFIMASLLLGLAPFVPEPHVWEKLKMLADGSLSKPIDIFDLLMHGAPWVLLIIKLTRLNKQPKQS
ncbi:MAG: RND transporter [Gammaproteobacteria bacterium]|nr:RND transporter [Gammaproteobacteria bacterium]NNJ92402.1 RND transporter [Gammaproteobacteria bacterium]